MRVATRPRHLQLAINEQGEVEQRRELCPDCVELEADIRKLKREVRRLKNELGEQRRQSPHSREAGELFDYWMRKRGKNPNRVVYDEKRKERALWAVKHYGLSRAKQVIDAQDLEPWKKGDKVYDDFCTIFKNASAVESFQDVVVQSCRLNWQPDKKWFEVEIWKRGGAIVWGRE